MQFCSLSDRSQWSILFLCELISICNPQANLTKRINAAFFFYESILSSLLKLMWLASARGATIVTTTTKRIDRKLLTDFIVRWIVSCSCSYPCVVRNRNLYQRWFPMWCPSMPIYPKKYEYYSVANPIAFGFGGMCRSLWVESDLTSRLVHLSLLYWYYGLLLGRLY